MENEKLICPICGKELHVHNTWSVFCENLIVLSCENLECKFYSIKFLANSESEARAAFRKATRADKQGIQLETLKYLNYLASSDADITDNHGDWEHKEVARRVLELEGINLPEGEEK